MEESKDNADEKKAREEAEKVQELAAEVEKGEKSAHEVARDLEEK